MGKKLEWTEEEALPLWSLKTFEEEARHNAIFIIDQFVINVSQFKTQHPGGSKILDQYVGKDATKAFYGALNNHTRSARQLVKDFRVAKIKD